MLYEVITEGVESGEDLAPHMAVDDFAAVRGDVHAVVDGVDDVAMLLGVGPFSQAGILDVGPLRDQDLGADGSYNFV